MSELDYLRFVYNSLDLDTLIHVYKSYPSYPPPKYFLLLCESCVEDLGENKCALCDSYLCDDCSYTCAFSGVTLCSTHAQICPICEDGCVCTSCRTYIVDSICAVCSENYQVPYHCGCSPVQVGDMCIICTEEMDPVTKERIQDE